MAAIADNALRPVLRVLVALLHIATAGKMGNATSAASTRSATGTEATAALVLKLARRRLAEVILLRGATVIATSNASTRSAIGMVATAEHVLRIVRRVLVTRRIGATVNATTAASTRAATGITATAALVLTVVL